MPIDQAAIRQRIVFPELRLVAYNEKAKAEPVACISGPNIPIGLAEKGGPELGHCITPLIDMLVRCADIRIAGGNWVIPDGHNNHPALSIGRQLLAVCESGKAGYHCMVVDDEKVTGRKYLVIQIDKQQKA